MIVSRTTSRQLPEGQRRPFVTLSHGTRRSSTITGTHLACGRRDVAEHPSLRVDENNAVSGRVAGVIFHFLSGNRDAAPEGYGGDRAMYGDDCDVMVALHLQILCLLIVGIAPASHPPRCTLLSKFSHTL